MDVKSLASRHLQQALKEVLVHSSEIEASDSALTQAVAAITVTHPAAKGKGLSTPSK